MRECLPWGVCSSFTLHRLISEYLPIEVADNDWLSETVDNGDTDVPGDGGHQMLELVQALTIRPRPTTAVQLSAMVREAVAGLARPPVAMSQRRR